MNKFCIVANAARRESILFSSVKAHFLYGSAVYFRMCLSVQYVLVGPSLRLLL